MANISNPDLALLRNALEKASPVEGYSINYLKAGVNAAFQAVEDWFTQGAVQTAVSNAINTATSPLVLTVSQKKIIVKFWLDWKSRTT